MCKDCQRFLHYLGRNELLEAFGGTDILQFAPADLKIDRGLEHLQSLQFNEKGLLRWYCGECKSPWGNMLPNPGLPFVGLPIRGLLQAEQIGQLTQTPLYIHGPKDDPNAPKGPNKLAFAGFIFKSLGSILWNKVTGRGKPHPFLNEKGTWIREAKVIQNQNLSS